MSEGESIPEGSGVMETLKFTAQTLILLPGSWMIFSKILTSAYFSCPICRTVVGNSAYLIKLRLLSDKLCRPQCLAGIKCSVNVLHGCYEYRGGKSSPPCSFPGGELEEAPKREEVWPQKSEE